MVSDADAAYVFLPWRGVVSVGLSVTFGSGIVLKQVGIAAQYGTIVNFFRTKHYGEIPTGFLCDGGRMQVRYEKIAIINQYIALSRNKCLQDRTAHSCHEKPTGTCLQFVELCHFLLP